MTSHPLTPPEGAAPTHHPLTPVSGYLPLTEDKIATVNVNKELEELVLRRIDEMRADASYDQRFVSIAATHFQEGFMAANRAVFKPGRINGPLALLSAWMKGRGLA